MKKKRAIEIGIAVAVLLIIPLAIILWALDRQKARRAWKDQAVAEIRKLAADRPWLTQRIDAIQKRAVRGRLSEEDWAQPPLALMQNGEWIIFRNACSKRERGIKDIFVGQGSNGKWYYSNYHFCIDATALRMDEQPADLATFIGTYFLCEFDGISDEALKETWPLTMGQ